MLIKKSRTKPKSNLDLATERAINIARKHEEEYYVVHDPSYLESPFPPYAIATEEELETFFLGCTVMFATSEVL